VAGQFFEIAGDLNPSIRDLHKFFRFHSDISDDVNIQTQHIFIKTKVNNFS
jgi:hypothetical protein